MTISIRKADPNDLQAIKELFVNCVFEVCKNDYGKDQLAAWASAANNSKRWLDKILEQYFIVAETQDTIIGFSSLQGADTVDLLYVHKGFQNIGAASMLFNALLERAKINGCQALKAEVSKTAKSFFERKGFALVKEQTKISDGVGLSNYHMVKYL
jgi:putative acetyltransferase